MSVIESKSIVGIGLVLFFFIPAIYSGDSGANHKKMANVVLGSWAGAWQDEDSDITEWIFRFRDGSFVSHRIIAFPKDKVFFEDFASGKWKVVDNSLIEKGNEEDSGSIVEASKNVLIIKHKDRQISFTRSPPDYRLPHPDGFTKVFDE